MLQNLFLYSVTEKTHNQCQTFLNMQLLCEITYLTKASRSEITHD